MNYDHVLLIRMITNYIKVKINVIHIITDFLSALAKSLISNFDIMLGRRSCSNKIK